ncbi:bifunctional cytochrome P450/NADPH--P450 reductase [Ancylobacter vacuolatus]|uniref:Bifunctional cytochrome P450/NADPH--P450 reductase n=1 Tax=Ancylobacter vacuolatus TaxID=223389 RepID=A0ABU0DGZ0_9HYPH|nr:cytochrome P450 [Ancylobacter vacuolatus]MDQ0347692.1 cytochrome P450/NADPH-cytochrome P450 reductase [Ancylobacter vacuolatus]
MSASKTTLDETAADNAPPVLKTIELDQAAGPVRVGWFPGASPEALREAIRVAAHLPAGAVFHVETPDGIVVALDDSVPDGTRLTLVTAGGDGAVAHESVPGPKPYPIVGNLPELHNADGLVGAVADLHARYGDFFAFKAPGGRAYFCADADIVSEMTAAPDVFAKVVEGRGGLGNLAEKSVGSALFTASDNDPLWHRAHRILAPAFGSTALKNYYGRIVEVADDLLAHLDRLGPDESFLATDLMTRMTFEAISYAAFNKRYDAIDSPALPPFVEAMNLVLVDAMQEPKRLLPEVFYHEARHQRAAADKIMLEDVNAIIRERRALMESGAPVPTDLLQVMLTTPDRVTGLKLPDDNIRGQLIVLLIAGHETTSGMLSYALYHLWKNPEVLEKLIAEVDQVLGRDFSYVPTYEDCGRLDYTQRVLKEALRLCPPVPMFPRYVTRDTTVGNGRYEVKAGERMFVSLTTLHTNPRFWGADAHSFRPDRFLPGEEGKHHRDAYHPFGMGVRSCIGFQFALLEARMVLARFIQRFTARPRDPHYVLRHKQALTVKPDHLEMLLERRPEVKGRFPVRADAPKEQPVPAGTAVAGRPMRVLYGSNMGGCRDIALALARDAASRGFAARVAELDEQAGQPWLTDGPVVIVTSTYNGTPPDNAAGFARWLDTAPMDACAGLRFAVLGCGNAQWRQTFQKFPRTVADGLAARGGTPLLEPGAADADSDFEAAVESWTAGLWRALDSGFAGQPRDGEAAAAPTIKVEVVNFAGVATGAAPRRCTALDQSAVPSKVRVNRELQAPGAPGSTRHIELPLPTGTTYAAGDHLGVFPCNPPTLVAAAVARCGFAAETTVLLTALTPEAEQESGLPFGVPVRVGELLSDHLDLAGPVTRRDLRAWAKAARCPPDQARIAQWLDDFPNVAAGKPRMLDLLAQLPSVTLDLATLLSVRPALKPRYYSISSSPLLSPDTCTLTVGGHRFNGADGTVHDGLCSAYLANCAEGTTLRVVVKDTGSAFHLPEDPLAPLILVGPGTGIAPLRGFIQERHALKAKGVEVGPVLLFFGCRNEGDYLYREELEAYQDEATLNLLAVAFSRREGTPKTYVQDLLRAHSATVQELVARGASILICGNARTMAPDVRAALTDILGAPALAELEAAHRYLQDVWASS